MEAAPQPQAEADAEQGRDDEREQQVERDRAEADPERAVGGAERDDGVDEAQPDVPSRIADTTWSAMKTTASSVRLRCRPWMTNRGVRPTVQPRLLAMPSSITAVRSRSEVSPVPRLKYQSAWLTSRPTPPPGAARSASAVPAGGTSAGAGSFGTTWLGVTWSFGTTPPPSPEPSSPCAPEPSPGAGWAGTTCRWRR